MEYMGIYTVHTENTCIYGLYGVYIRRRKSHIRFGPTPYIYSINSINGVYGRPRAKPPPNRVNKLPIQFKAPYSSSECKILYDIISEPLTFAGNSAFWGAVWGPVRILHPLWQGKGAFLKLP
jgi:hypothetical protein